MNRKEKIEAISKLFTKEDGVMDFAEFNHTILDCLIAIIRYAGKMTSLKDAQKLWIINRNLLDRETTKIFKELEAEEKARREHDSTGAGGERAVDGDPSDPDPAGPDSGGPAEVPVPVSE